jgi:hypothetical protein
VTSAPPSQQFGALITRLYLASSSAAKRLRPALVVLGIVFGLVPAPVQTRLRCSLLVYGIVLGISGVWLLLPVLLRPTPIGLPLDPKSAEAAADHRMSSILAAELGAIRGDLWAEAAFTGARFIWTDRGASFGPASSRELARIRADAETSLALAPVNGAAWLLLAALPETAPDRDSRVSALLEMSYFTAPNELRLANLRVMRAVISSALADKDIQAFIKTDIRKILTHRPDYQNELITAYREALPQNQPIFESLIADVDPALATLLRSSPSK